MTRNPRSVLENDILIRSLQKAMRNEMKKIYAKQDNEIAHLVLLQLIHENRLEIIPNGRK